jgi:serine/threonine protein phosphatase PrpC
MLRNINNNIKQKKENEKIIKRKMKRKSKSINKLNIKKEKKVEDKYLSIQNKKIKIRNTRIEIDANKPNIKNKFKTSKLKIEESKQSNLIQNKNKYYNSNTFNNNKKRHITHIKINVHEEKKINKNENELKENKDDTQNNILNKQEINLNNLNKIKIEIKKEEPQKSEEKIKKEEVPLLNLCDINSSHSSSNKEKNNSDSSDDLTESNSGYENSLEMKEEIISKNKRNKFMNEIKKCLFNNEIKNDSVKYIETDKLNKINLKLDLSTTESQDNEKIINITSSFITKAGIDDKKEKINQDSYLILEKLFENILNIYGIFDGHGKNGHLISSLLSTFLSQYLKNKDNYCLEKKNNNDSDSDSSISSQEIIINNELISKLFSNEDFIRKIIAELDLKANESNFDLQFSGTTCLLLFLFEDYIICSNIGDSMCVLFNCSNEDRWTYDIISKIHKPDIQSEKDRVLLNGGVIHPYYDELGIFEGPNRVYVKGKTYPGLSLTRSIGDLEAEKIGIISEPDIIIKKKDSTCKYLVLGSDGLWDVIKPYDVRRIVNPYFLKSDTNGACNALLKTACKNWDKEGCERDDITIIVVFIGTPN